MKPDELVSIGNVRRNYGDLTELLASIDHVGLKVPLAYYEQRGRNILWDGHRRLLCVKIINVIAELRASDKNIKGSAILPHLELQNATVDVFSLNTIGLRGAIIDVPVIKMAPPRGSSQAIEFQLVCAAEGLREPLSPIEEAEAINDLLALGKKNLEIAALLGKSEAYVSRRSRLVKLHQDFKDAVNNGELSARAAEEILVLDDDSDELLRKSIVGAGTQRRVRAKVLAANAARKVKLQPALDIVEQNLGVEDPLILVKREEARLAVIEACKALVRAAELYKEVDVKPDLNDLKVSMKWVTKKGE